MDIQTILHALRSYNIDVQEILEDKKESNDSLYTITFKQDELKVEIKGLYPDVMAVISVLKKHPPITQTQLHNQIHTGVTIVNGSSLKKPIATLSRGIDNKHAYLHIDDKCYSGSGALLMINEYVILFKDTTGLYQETGGKIDMYNAEAYIEDEPEKILFYNAQKEVLEESANLIKLDVESTTYVDIESPINHTWYRVYLYKFDETLDNIYSWFKHNNDKIRESTIYGPGYREIDDIKFVKFATLNKLCHSTAPYEQITLPDGEFIKIRDRTIKALCNLNRKITATPTNNKQVDNVSLSGLICVHLL